MLLNTRSFAGLPVETRGGVSVGRLVSADVDADTGRIATFHVKSGGLVSGLLSDELMIAWDQVVEWTDEKLMVADGAVPADSRVLAKASRAVASSASMMEG